MGQMFGHDERELVKAATPLNGEPIDAFRKKKVRRRRRKKRRRGNDLPEHVPFLGLLQDVLNVGEWGLAYDVHPLYRNRTDILIEKLQLRKIELWESRALYSDVLWLQRATLCEDSPRNGDGAIEFSFNIPENLRNHLEPRSLYMEVDAGRVDERMCSGFAAVLKPQEESGREQLIFDIFRLMDLCEGFVWAKPFMLPIRRRNQEVLHAPMNYRPDPRDRSNTGFAPSLLTTWTYIRHVENLVTMKHISKEEGQALLKRSANRVDDCATS